MIHITTISGILPPIPFNSIVDHHASQSQGYGCEAIPMDELKRCLEECMKKYSFLLFFVGESALRALAQECYKKMQRF